MTSGFIEQNLANLESILIPTFDENSHSIFIVGENKENCSEIKSFLNNKYNVSVFTNTDVVLKAIEEKNGNVTLIISEQKSSPLSGTLLFSKIEQKYPDIIKVLISDDTNLESLINAISECHLFQYILKPLKTEQINMTVQSAIEHYELTSSHGLLLQDLSELFYKTIKSIAHVLDAKDKYTHGHSLRVTLYSLVIAKKLNLPDKMLEEIETTGLLHDIGKIAIPEEILHKPDNLNDNEYSIIKDHTTIGEKLVNKIDRLKIVGVCLKAHHERFDGKGYPKGLKGEQIPLYARIIAIADTYDAMTSNRPYRNALSHKQAIEEIAKCAGSQFDPKLVKIFIQEEKDIELMKNNTEKYYAQYSYLDKMYLHVNKTKEEDFDNV